jgi:hypothetical protein
MPSRTFPRSGRSFIARALFDHAHANPSAHESLRVVGITIGIVVPIFVLLAGLVTFLAIRRRRAAQRDGRGGAGVIPAEVLKEDPYMPQVAEVVRDPEAARQSARRCVYPENGLTPFPYTPAPDGGFPKTARIRMYTASPLRSGFHIGVGSQAGMLAKDTVQATRTAAGPGLSAPLLFPAPVHPTWRSIR